MVKVNLMLASRPPSRRDPAGPRCSGRACGRPAATRDARRIAPVNASDAAMHSLPLRVKERADHRVDDLLPRTGQLGPGKFGVWLNLRNR